MQPQPEYTIVHRFNRFHIYRWKRRNGSATGSLVATFTEFEDARKELYRLNGWKYKPKDKPQNERQ
jgi:hypothetical protein